MATDATGTPTSPDSLAIIDPSADAPSGVGQNSLANSIQTALGNYLRKTLLSSTGDLVYASAANTLARLGIGSSGEVLTVAGGVPTWAAAAAAATVGFGTSFPGSPADGYDYILVDSTSAPTYAWRFRYVAAASTYKWYFIGGVEKSGFYNASVNSAAGSGVYDTPFDVSPAMTAPRS